MCQSIVLRVLLVAFAIFSLDQTALATKAPVKTEATCASELAKVVPMFKRSENMVQVSENGGLEPEYIGLTEEGIDRLVTTSEDIRVSAQILNYRNFEMENFIDALRIAQAARTNMFVYGGGGGAKTSFFEQAIPSDILFKKQLNPTLTEIGLIGGQTREGLEAGREDINTKDTIVDAKYVLLDEGEKAPPQLQAVLLGLLNERSIEVRGKSIKAKDLRSIVFTGNSNLPDFLMSFMIGGGGMNTGAPFLNRFAFKLRFPNWLTESPNRIALIDRRLEANRLKVLEDEDPRASEAMVFQKAPHPDMIAVEKFAKRSFTISQDLKSTLDAVVVALRDSTHAKMRAMAQDETTKQTNPFGLVPPADFTTRLYAGLVDTIQVSAALDFLKSGLATHDKIRHLTQKPIELGKLSLWRLWYIFTTVGPNRTVFDPVRREVHFSVKFNKQGDLVPYDWQKSIESAKDVKEQQELNDIQAEQGRFTDALKAHWKGMDIANEELAKMMSADLFDIENVKIDFEIQLAKAGGTNVIRLPDNTPSPVAPAPALPATEATEPLTSGPGGGRTVSRPRTAPAKAKTSTTRRKAAVGKNSSASVKVTK